MCSILNLNIQTIYKVIALDQKDVDKEYSTKLLILREDTRSLLVQFLNGNDIYGNPINTSDIRCIQYAYNEIKSLVVSDLTDPYRENALKYGSEALDTVLRELLSPLYMELMKCFTGNGELSTNMGMREG